MQARISTHLCPATRTTLSPWRRQGTEQQGPAQPAIIVVAFTHCRASTRSGRRCRALRCPYPNCRSRPPVPVALVPPFPSPSSPHFRRPRALHIRPHTHRALCLPFACPPRAVTLLVLAPLSRLIAPFSPPVWCVSRPRTSVTPSHLRRAWAPSCCHVIAPSFCCAVALVLPSSRLPCPSLSCPHRTIVPISPADTGARW
ncbi:hypothetical protein DENSPDRAFT_886992 [Dentipellis sp. KUC8613]|nr:hypothetical protein DENSPDRAFT_886992 [Dentipellis sp. KUC8613]